MADYVEKRILIVVKTYPNPSSTYGETVCCAGVDLESGEWARLYPITFRGLADRQFEKFQEIRWRATRPRDDTRPESWRVDQDSIELVGEPMKPGVRGWQRRMVVLPTADRSIEEIRAAQSTRGTSLGMIRPREVVRLLKRPAEPWTEKQRAYLRRQHLNLGAEVSRELSELEQIPWSFAYEFRCDDAGCLRPHTLSIIDWEIGAAYRRWKRTYGDAWEEKLRQKFEVELPASDLHLVVGNLAAHHQTFVIIGLVRPPRPKVDGGYVQESLDLMGEKRPVASMRIGLEAEQADPLSAEQGDEALKLFPDEG